MLLYAEGFLLKCSQESGRRCSVIGKKFWFLHFKMMINPRFEVLIEEKYLKLGIVAALILE